MSGIKNNYELNGKGIHSNVFLKNNIIKTIKDINFYYAKVSTGSANKTFTYNSTTNWIRHKNSDDVEGYMIYTIVNILADGPYNCILKSLAIADEIENIEEYYNEHKSDFQGTSILSKNKIGDNLYLTGTSTRLNFAVSSPNVNNHVYYVLTYEGEYITHLHIAPV